MSDELRFVQLTPPGSACSIAIGKGITQMEPGSIEGLQVVVEDIEAARDALAERAASRCPRSRTSRGAGSCSSRTPTATAGPSSRSWSRRASERGGAGHFFLRPARRLRLRPPLRSAAGISVRTTSLVSETIVRSRNFAIRSSWRRYSRASLAVSLSPTASASVSIAL